MNNYLKSPLNYTGNKNRILDQIMPYFPQNCDLFVDVFCGGATVGINVNAKKVIFIDSNKRVISLLKFLAKSEYEDLIKKLEELIDKYNLSYSAKNGYSYYIDISKPTNKNNGLRDYNRIGFYKLRSDYNNIIDKETEEANLLLYLLLVYGFNNDLRFNSNGEYNLPCGKTDLNSNNIKKIKAYIERAQKCEFQFICGDFREEKIQKIILKADFFYLDPPYLITDAVYNESNGWNEDKEKKLISFLENCRLKGKSFVLSNVLSKQNGHFIVNEILNKWIHDNNDLKMIDINYHYRSSSYNKKNRNSKEREIIVVAGGEKNEDK